MTPDAPPYSAPYSCVSTWNSAMESTVTRDCGNVPVRSSLLYWPSTRYRLLPDSRPFALYAEPSNDPARRAGVIPGTNCSKANCSRPCIGRLSTSAAVRFLPISVWVTSMIGVSPVTVISSDNVPTGILKLMVTA